MGNLYEFNRSSNQVTKYYYFGGQRVAMRNNAGVRWLHGDNLGSASVATSDIGAKIAEARYTPFGSSRYQWSNLPTDKRFTGQRLEDALGLYDYGARFFDPLIGRFISADTIVPRPGDPQAFNRYMYARANPLRRVDPSGHADGIVESIGGFIYGFTAGLSEANNPYIPGWVQQATDSLTTQDSSFAAGRAAGNVAGIVQGLAEVVIGGSADVGGGGLCATGVGCVVGAPALVVGTAIATHGLAVEINAVGKLQGTVTLMASQDNQRAIRGLEKGISSLEKQIGAHQGKIAQYRENPDSMDNLGLLRGVPLQVRELIIKGRIAKLEREISKFQNEVAKKAAEIERLKAK